MLSKQRHIFLFYALLVAYLAANTYVLVYKRNFFYLFQLIPVGIVIAYTTIYNIDKLVFFMVFATPLAITLKNMGISDGIDLSLPTEPLMALIMVVYLINQLKFRVTDIKVLKHPITRIIILQLIWMAITMLFSESVLISFKYLVARMWFVFSCYFMTAQLFKERKNLNTFILVYAVSLALVCIYTILEHSQYNFDDKTADWVVSPFYNDHTAYGAVLAMFIPVLIAMLFQKNNTFFVKSLSLGLLALFVLAIILSFARAGWLSLVLAFGVLLTILLKMKFRTILFIIVIGGGVFLAFQEEILIALGRNNTDAEGGFANNIESVTNISTDASNLERLNRWSCAIRMFYDKPFLGWGPGTYQFYYAPYQLSKDRTIISTNFGTNGNAHSEYLGSLCEQGLLGSLLFFILLFATMFLGYRLAYTVKDRNLRFLSIGVFLGTFTYFVHGFLNNFLDTDKLSVPFWGFLAILVCIDTYHKDTENAKEETASLAEADYGK